VSHDLRAPLRHIDGYVDILATDHKDDLGEEAHHALRAISSSARKMSQLIDDLLGLARTSRQPLQVGLLRMDALLEEALAQVYKSCQDRKIEWVFGPLPAIHGDAGLLRQVWINLLENAVKYSRRQDIARIEIGCVQTDRETLFHVRDNGAGFDMKYADKLFGVFQRLHRPDEFEGTGIGLVTVRRIVERHKGRIWAESAPDMGATFTFALPRS
jgi:light-regulated signal transduction histidine kinase (bacteriophytochrome)